MIKHNKLKLPFHIIFAIILLAKICAGEGNEQLSGSVTIDGPTIVRIGESGTFTATKTDDVNFAGGGWSVSGNTATKTITKETAQKFDVTCTVTKNGDSFTAEYTCYWIDIRIKRDINNNITDITDDTTEVWVGEKISLNAEILPENSGLSMDNISWDIPKERIKDYTFTENKGEVEPLTLDDLEENNIDFYWVNGTVAGVLKKVEFNFDCNETRLQQTTTFKVNSPALNFRRSLQSAPALLYISTLENQYGLFKGNDGNNSGTEVGIEIVGGIGDSTWAQTIISSHFERWYYLFYIFEMKDDDYIFNGLDTLDDFYLFYDSPGRGIFNCDYRSKIDYSMFNLCFMFKPPGNEAIYVPVWRCYWDWSATAEGSVNQENWTIIDFFDEYRITLQENIVECIIPEWDHKN